MTNHELLRMMLCGIDADPVNQTDSLLRPVQ